MRVTVLGQEASLTRRIEPLVQRVEAGLWDAAVMVDECELRRQEAAAATSTLCAQLRRNTEGAVRGGTVPVACVTPPPTPNGQSIERPCRRRNRVLNHHHRIVMMRTQAMMSGNVGEYQSLGDRGFINMHRRRRRGWRAWARSWRRPRQRCGTRR
eukprot:COSAG01_NODE_7592_length_3135_cov_1.832016_3_plen_155_part_00